MSEFLEGGVEGIREKLWTVPWRITFDQLKFMAQPLTMTSAGTKVDNVEVAPKIRALTIIFDEVSLELTYVTCHRAVRVETWVRTQ